MEDFRSRWKSFDSRWQRSESRFNFRRVAMAIIVVSIACTFAWWAFVSALAYNVSQLDFSGGVKPVIETVWCGKPGCMDK